MPLKPMRGTAQNVPARTAEGGFLTGRPSVLRRSGRTAGQQTLHKEHLAADGLLDA